MRDRLRNKLMASIKISNIELIWNFSLFTFHCFSKVFLGIFLMIFLTILTIDFDPDSH